MCDSLPTSSNLSPIFDFSISFQMTTRTTARPLESPDSREDNFGFNSDSSQSGDSDGAGQIGRAISTPSYRQQKNVPSPSDNATSVSDTHGSVESPPPLATSTSFVPNEKPASNVPGGRFNSVIKDDIWLLHADEMVSLSQGKRPALQSSDSYYMLGRKIVSHYFHFLRITWARCAWSLLVLPGSECPYAT